MIDANPLVIPCLFGFSQSIKNFKLQLVKPTKFKVTSVSIQKS